MSKIEIGYRILISHYGYYGSIGRPYVMYQIKSHEILEGKEELITNYLEKFKGEKLNCEGSNSGILDSLEHLVVQVYNRVSPIKVNCLHPYFDIKKIRRMDHADSIVLPLTNRVISTKIMEHVVDCINEENDELISESLVNEVEERSPDSVVIKLLKLLDMKKIPYYDTEDDSRLVAIGEGKFSIVIAKKTSNNQIKYLKYPYPVLDLDAINEKSWLTFDFSPFLEEYESDELITKLMERWGDFSVLIENGTISKFLVTGTNGKTSTTRILAHVVRNVYGKTTGITSTSGIFIDGLEPEYGDFTGPWSARNMLLKPVEIGVFEVARGGLIREGVIFDEVDTAIITNVAADHIGLRGIDTVEQMVKVKSLVLHAATKSIVLNADDPYSLSVFKEILAYRIKLKPSVEIWGVSSDREKLIMFDQGLLIEDGNIFLMDKSLIPTNWNAIASLKELKISKGGLISFMNINAALACAAALSNDIELKNVLQHLYSIEPNLSDMPGRGNFFEKSNRWFMLDYGHNPHALFQINATIQNIKSQFKINKVIFLALTAGDRREEDLVEYGKMLASFPIDAIIFKDLWVDLRGRKKGEVGKFVEEVMRQEGFEGEVFQKPDPEEAVKFAIETSNSGDLVYLCAEKADIMMKLISDHNFEG